MEPPEKLGVGQKPELKKPITPEAAAWLPEANCYYTAVLHVPVHQLASDAFNSHN
jgi:hypothetical protein